MKLVSFFSMVISILFLNTVAFAESLVVPLVMTEAKSAGIVTSDQADFMIKLKSNPTTGYSWFLRGYDEKLVAPVKHVFQAPISQLVGAPGYELWTFRMKPASFVVPHQTLIRFAYARPWESAKQSKEVVFSITTASFASKNHSQK